MSKQTQHTQYSRGPSLMQVDFQDKEPSSGKGRSMPPAVLRKIAMKSTAGGTNYCKFCGRRFAAYYCKLCKIGAFGQDHVCADCRKEHPEARPIPSR